MADLSIDFSPRASRILFLIFGAILLGPFAGAGVAIGLYVLAGRSGETVARVELHGPGTATARATAPAGTPLRIWLSQNATWKEPTSGPLRREAEQGPPALWALRVTSGGATIFEGPVRSLDCTFREAGRSRTFGVNDDSGWCGTDKGLVAPGGEMEVTVTLSYLQDDLIREARDLSLELRVDPAK